MIGTPPRIAAPPLNAEGSRRKSRSVPPAGSQDVTWAPWRYTSARAPSGALTTTFGVSPSIGRIERRNVVSGLGAARAGAVGKPTARLVQKRVLIFRRALTR